MNKTRVLVVLVGINAARAFGAGSIAYFEEFLLGRVNAVGTNTRFKVRWQSPDLPAPTILQGGVLVSGTEGPGYIKIEYVSAMVIPS